MWYVVVYVRATSTQVFGPFDGLEAAEEARRRLSDKDGYDPELLIVARLEQR